MPSAFSPGPLSCVPLSCISTGYCAVRQTRRHQVCVSNTSVASRGWGTTLTCLHSNGELHLTLPSRCKIVALLIVWKLPWITKTMQFSYLFLISIRNHLHIHHKMLISAVESSGERTVFHFLWNCLLQHGLTT